MNLGMIIKLMNRIKPETVDLVWAFIQQFNHVKGIYEANKGIIDDPVIKGQFIDSFVRLIELGNGLDNTFKGLGINFGDIFKG